MWCWNQSLAGLPVKLMPSGVESSSITIRIKNNFISKNDPKLDARSTGNGKYPAEASQAYADVAGIGPKRTKSAPHHAISVSEGASTDVTNSTTKIKKQQRRQWRRCSTQRKRRLLISGDESYFSKASFPGSDVSF